MRPEMEEDERKKERTKEGERKKKCFLKIDFSLTPRGGLTGRQVGVWIEGGRELKEEGRLFETQKQMKEVFWQNRQRDGDTQCKHSADTHTQNTHTHEPSDKHKSVLAKTPDLNHCFTRVHAAALLIDAFRQIAAHKMQVCASVNKYFGYFVLAYPSPLPSVSIDWCMIYTLYDSF